MANEKKAKENANAAREQSRIAFESLNAMILICKLQNRPNYYIHDVEAERKQLTEAVGRLEALSRTFIENSPVDRTTAVLLDEMGNLLIAFGRNRGPGDPSRLESAALEACRRLFTRTRTIFDVLAQAEPNDIQARSDLSRSYDKLNDLYNGGATSRELFRYYLEDLERSEASRRPTPATPRPVASFPLVRQPRQHLPPVRCPRRR